MILEHFLLQRPVSYQPPSNLWNENGVLILDKFVPSDILDGYAKYGPFWHGDRREATAYMHNEDLLRLCTFAELAERLEMLCGEPMGVHLNLTGHTSTARQWHQDSYLNLNVDVQDRYLAVWFALDDIHPDSGPFEYIPGSHRWGLFDNNTFLKYCLDHCLLTGSEVSSGLWHKKSEQILTPLVEEKIRRDKLEVKRFLGKKGDVLIWNHRMWHQGSQAKVPGMTRKALIAHYSSIHRRPDFPTAKQIPGAGWYFPIGR